MGGNAGKTTLQLNEDGLPNDDVTHDLATQEQIRSYERAAAQMRDFKVPALRDIKDPHSYVLYGLLDGTGNDVNQDELHATNIAKLHAQIKALKEFGTNNIASEYKEGPGTQTTPVQKYVDGATGRTSLFRAEEMYEMLMERAQRIREQDPKANINIHLEGFSRGASTVPLLARMIHERGIPDHKSEVESVDANGNITRTYTRHLQPPGATPMSVGLYDPVATGHLEDYFDRRLPPSVVAGFQINAAHERRGLFPVDRILRDGLSEDGRFLSVTVAGVHSDIGGSYLRGGLGDRSLNLMTDFRNALAGETLFQTVPETSDPRMNVIHHSTEGNVMFRYWPKADRATPKGEVLQLAPDHLSEVTPDGVMHVPVQAPDPASDMTLRLRAQAMPVTQTPRIDAPEQAAADALMSRVLRDPNIELRPYEPPVQLSTGQKVLLGLTAAGGVVSVAEAGDAGQRTGAMLALDNPDAARAVLERYAAKGVGGWAGGALAGAAVGWETGPGVIGFVVAGAIAGSELGERASQHWDNLKILEQTDRSGMAWTFNGRVWQRDGMADTTQDGIDNPAEIRITASRDKARELNYEATNVATALALGRTPTPTDPFTLPAEPGDRHSLARADWKFDADSGQWQREVVTQLLERGTKVTETDIATPQRAAELSDTALRIAQANVATGPAAIAERYEAAYVRSGWSDYGPMPEAVRTALMDQDRLMASDGRVYQRQPDGEWMHRGGLLGDTQAQGNLRLELDTTRLLLQADLARHAESLNQLEPRALRSPETTRREDLVYRYGVIGTDLQPDWQDAILLATERTREAHGIAGPGAVQIKPLPGETPAADSPIAHLQRDSDGTDRVVAVTGREEILQALEDVRARRQADDASRQQPQELRAERATPEQNEARMQAEREANRMGLSREEAQQAAVAASMGAAVRAPVLSAGGRHAVADTDSTPQPEAERKPPPPATMDTPQTVAPAAPPRASGDEAERERAEAEHKAAAQTDAARVQPESAAPEAPRTERTTAAENEVERREALNGDIAKSQAKAAVPEPSPAPTPARPVVEDPQQTAVRPRDDAAHATDRPRQQDADPQRVPDLAQQERQPLQSNAETERRNGSAAAAMVEAQNSRTPDATTAPAVVREDGTPLRNIQQDGEAPGHRQTLTGGGAKRRDETEEAPIAPARPAPPQLPDQSHAAHLLWMQTQSAMSRATIPGLESLDMHTRERLVAGTVAQSLSSPGWNLRAMDHVVPSTHTNPATGLPQTLFAVQGDPESPAAKRVPIDVSQAMATSIEQSSQVAQAVMAARDIAQMQELLQAQQLGQEPVGGPTMKIGGLRLGMPSAQQEPDGPKGGGDGGGGGGGGGG